MRAAVIHNGMVVNVVEVDDLNFSPGDGMSLVASDTAAIGDSYGDGDFSKPADPAPTELDLLRYANEKQWMLAVGGFTVNVGGTNRTFATDPTSLGLITGKSVRFGQANPPANVDWQFATGFVTISAANFISAAIEIADFVQATFDALKSIEQQILAGALFDFAGINNADWPANSP